ncbi:hypothetical protein ACTMTI_35185 [Nonomuraea sp. H19]|uniref:hypothetical protein n=1 Tax=Nonomuraea sp. H19 TaxID=3452206 RepID=UPI003F8B0CAB
MLPQLADSAYYRDDVGSDLVRRNFSADVPGQKMIGDITQIDTGEGALSVIDCFSKSVIGWALNARYPASLVCAAIDMAAARIEMSDGAIFHSNPSNTRRSSSVRHSASTTSGNPSGAPGVFSRMR